MDKELTKFWLTCPFCKRKFGVYPDVVVKYVDRLLSSLGDDIRRKFDEKAKEQNGEK